MTARINRSIAKLFRVLLRIPVPWVFVLTYLIGVVLELTVPLLDVRSLAILNGIKIAGVVIFVAGAAIAGWSLYKFYRARTTTTPGQKSSELVTTGFYRFSRNPMYVGFVLAYIGEAGLLVQIWPLILLPLVIAYVNWIVIPVEEARLAADFGIDYERYREKVRRWI
jgi:protein-S-isoprenylcysteine O-methyltransferase Ste14